VEVIQIITFVKERKKASLFAIQSIGYEKTTTHTHTHTLLQGTQILNTLEKNPLPFRFWENKKYQRKFFGTLQWNSQSNLNMVPLHSF
jgi:hypothetical protein